MFAWFTGGFGFFVCWFALLSLVCLIKLVMFDTIWLVCWVVDSVALTIRFIVIVWLSFCLTFVILFCLLVILVAWFTWLRYCFGYLELFVGIACLLFLIICVSSCFCLITVVLVVDCFVLGVGIGYLFVYCCLLLFGLFELASWLFSLFLWCFAI